MTEDLIDVACIGSCNMDIIMHVNDVLRFELFDKSKDIIKKYTAIEYSTKVNVESIKFAPGGSAANVACDLTYLDDENASMTTAYIGKLGKDFMGNECLMDLRDHHHVNTEGVILSEQERTGVAVILITPYGKDRSILAHKGANNMIVPSEINIDLINKSKNLVWTSLTSKSGIASIQKCIDVMKEQGKTIFAAPSISILRYSQKEARKLVEQSDVLSLNKEELEALTEVSGVTSGIEAALEMGPKIVACTNGKEGSFISDGEVLIRADTYQVDVKDTTGAGDAFFSGLIYGIIYKMKLKELIKFASAYAAFECMVLGVREGFPNNTREVINYIRSNDLDLKEKTMYKK
ncbi:MAG: carbohydrate kinase family protein [Candidatus Helarchaeota archaeon]